MNIKQLADFQLQAKRLLIRQDLNVPIQAGTLSSTKRIEAALPTIEMAVKAGAKVLLMSHCGRPSEGQADARYSLQPVADFLSEKLRQPVALNTDYLTTPPVLKEGEVVLLENVRFNQGEKANDAQLAKRYAQLCDIYVMDAFATAHRVHASTYGVGVYAPQACAGPLLIRELTALSQALDAPKRPLVAIVGGAKVSTKLTVLAALSQTVDQLLPGGGIANTFIAAAGYNVGKSLFEKDLVAEAQSLLIAAKAKGNAIPVPTDVVVAKAFSTTATATIKRVEAIADDDMIFDIGPETSARFAQIMHHAGTIVWNGPVGVFEFEQFAAGTQALGEAIAAASAFSIAGGGDTLAAIDKYAIAAQISYISTGGGAFLEFLEGQPLPAIAMLKKRAQVDFSST